MKIKEQILEFRPPRIAMLLTILALPAHWLLPLARLPSYPIAAAIVIALGFGIMLRAWWLFKQRATAICPTVKASVLVTDDIFVLTRNPMYLGMILMLLGCALWAGTLPFYAVSITYFAIINYVFCPFEEQNLQSAFGEEYVSYQRRVRRWL